MCDTPEKPIESEETEHTTPPEPGALFLRVESKTVQPLTSFQAGAIEGLLSLMGSDDWKETFITEMLHAYRDGNRESPADVRWSLEQVTHQFEMELGVARSMYRDYRPLFQTEASGREVYVVVGSGIPQAAPSPKRKPASKRRRAAK